MLRCNRGQTDIQRWMVRYEIAQQRAIEAWLDITTPKPDVAAAAAAVVAEVDRFRDAARERLRAEARQTYVGTLAGLEAQVDAVAQPEANDAMREAAIETVWTVDRRARVHQFLISNNLGALMALVMTDLSESQRETLMNLIFQQRCGPYSIDC